MSELVRIQLPDSEPTGEGRDLDARNADIYRLRKVNRWTLVAIGERYGISMQRVGQIVDAIDASLPPLDLEAIRMESFLLYDDIQRRAYELADMAGAPVTAGKDGAIVYDGDQMVRDYSGRVAALSLALKADAEKRKLHGLDAAQRIETSGSVRYEVAGVNLDLLT